MIIQPQTAEQTAIKKGLRSFLSNLVYAAIASLLFAASFPNLIFTNGLALLAWIAYVPVFMLVRRISFAASFFWGALYGYSAYGLFNYWLSVFHPLAGLIVGSIYLVYLALLFPILHLAAAAFPRRGYLVQWVIWMAYEYARTLGFLGYSYGITGYSQWNTLPVIQIASVTGVWGVSALVVFPSAWLAAALSGPGEQGLGNRDYHLNPDPRSPIPDPRSLLFGSWPKIKAFFKREWLSAAIWLVFLSVSLVYGFVSPIDYSGERKVKTALIQHNTDPWQPAKAATAALAFEEYRKDFRILRRLSDEAMAAHPDTDLVVWSETAFVPRIYWHTVIRDDRVSWDLVKELLDYLAKQEIPFVIGNDDARKDPALNPRFDNRVDYNAAMLFERGELISSYRKLHLVPFTEHFPYEKQLPWIYNALKKADTHFWEKGKDVTVFNTNGIKFSTPICFEDTFGYLSRNFVKNGAELIVNLSNDAWSTSLPAQMQHLSMAVFRTVENRRAMVRSTASGQTCGIDPNGKILAMAEAFTESALVVEVPLVSGETIYTRYGDYLGKVFAAAGLFLLIICISSCILKRLPEK